jgi:ABC-type nitrate/sulfonate/bicarbonate transport system substrate-binding protein
MKTFYIALSFLLIMTDLPVFAQIASAQVEKAIIGYPSRSYNVLVLHVAETKGFFREEKLEPVLVQMGVGPGMLAVLNGDIHYYWAFSAPVNGIINGMPVKIVAIVNRLLHEVVARPMIRTATDLQAKKMGVSRIEGADHLQAKAILRAKGVDVKSIQFINLGGGDPARVLALKKGLVDAIAVSPPNPYTLQKEGYSVLGGPRDLKLGLLASALSTTDQRLKETPEQVRKVLRALLRGLTFVRENRQETINIMMRWLNDTQEIASASYDVLVSELSKDGTFPDAEIEFSVEQFKTSVGSTKPIPIGQVRDFTVLRQVQKDLGVR